MALTCAPLMAWCGGSVQGEIFCSLFLPGFSGYPSAIGGECDKRTTQLNRSLKQDWIHFACVSSITPVLSPPRLIDFIIIVLHAGSFHRVLSAIAAPSSWSASPVSLEIVSGCVWGLYWLNHHQLAAIHEPLSPKSWVPVRLWSVVEDGPLYFTVWPHRKNEDLTARVSYDITAGKKR